MHPFEPRLQTSMIQEAVRTGDRTRLADLVDERFLFSSTRVTTKIDKAAWIEWACATEWVSFEVGEIQDLSCGGAHLVAFVVDQRIGGTEPSASRWLVTDLWVENERSWQLISRHPELASLR